MWYGNLWTCPSSENNRKQKQRLYVNVDINSKLHLVQLELRQIAVPHLRCTLMAETCMRLQLIHNLLPLLPHVLKGFPSGRPQSEIKLFRFELGRHPSRKPEFRSENTSVQHCMSRDRQLPGLVNELVGEHVRTGRPRWGTTSATLRVPR